MVQKIVTVKTPSLRQKSKTIDKVDKKVLKLIADMKDTLAAQDDPEGIGLAAPQIGKNLRVFIINYKNCKRIIINPKVIKLAPIDTKKNKNRKKILEGCLSLPHYYGPIIRSNELTLEYLDETGKKIVEVFKGFVAHIVQHEVDHLDGKLFIDKILEQKAPLYKFDGEEWEEVTL